MNIIAHNLFAINTQNQYNKSVNKSATAAERLSSGLRINRAADDAAGLAISEKMRGQINGLNKGKQNTQDGISLCQVADGALVEVSQMMNRITKLSVQAANGNLSDSDRQSIQKEISELLIEINNIGKNTEFNTIKLFNGNDVLAAGVGNAQGTRGDIPFKDFALTDVTLGQVPFSKTSSANHLELSAIINNKDSAMYNEKFNLLFGNGSTSRSSMRIQYDGKEVEIPLSSLKPENYRTTDQPPTWSRDFTYTNSEGIKLKITQTVKDQSTPTAAEKNYGISYKINNQTADTSKSINVDFLFHADTAYNNNDSCEGYYVDGTNIDKVCAYSSSSTSPFTAGSQSNYVKEAYDEMPRSFSVVDTERALSFSEKITLNNLSLPDTIAIGHYSQIRNWSYYDEIKANTNQSLGNSTNRMDLGFSLLWNDTLDQYLDEITYEFNYGIAQLDQDTNLKGVAIKKDNKPVSKHEMEKKIWIQSGANEGQGMFIEIDEMNTAVLGVTDLNVYTQRGAQNAIERSQKALESIVKIQGKIGAQQNRLEHVAINADNSAENLQSAESRIRDADMAKEMVAYTKNNVLTQAGQQMIKKANVEMQSILELIK